MKRLTMCSAALLGALYLAPAWSHHPAEGIISEDLWNRINDHLIAVDSPHLSIDFGDVMGSMRVMDSMRLQDDSNYGCLLLVTSLRVPESYAYHYAAHVEFALDELMDEVGNQYQNVSAGSERQPCNAPGFEVEDLGDGTAEILFYEPIGVMAGPPAVDPGEGTGNGSDTGSASGSDNGKGK